MKPLKTLLAGLCLATSLNAQAGLYTDDLSRCLVEATSSEDRVNLVKWIFFAATAHPAVKPIATLSAEQMDVANKQAGDLLMRLLTVSCRTATEKAIKYEGSMALQAGFQILGQVAGQELFSSPEVANAMGGFEKYLDTDKLNALGK